MSSLPFRATTEKFKTSNPTSSALQESQPGSYKLHVTEQGSPINSSPTHAGLDQEVDTATQEKTSDLVQPDDHPEYPHGLKLATITVAVALSVFLVALVRYLEVFPGNVLPSANCINTM